MIDKLNLNTDYTYMYKRYNKQCLRMEDPKIGNNQKERLPRISTDINKNHFRDINRRGVITKLTFVYK